MWPVQKVCSRGRTARGARGNRRDRRCRCGRWRECSRTMRGGLRRGWVGMPRSTPRRCCVYARRCHHSARGRAGRKDGELLVVAVDAEHGGVDMKIGALGFPMRAYFVVVAALGFVAHYFVEGIECAHAHHLHDALLQHVAEHLRVVAAGL